MVFVHNILIIEDCGKPNRPFFGAPIRRDVQTKDVPLPHDWHGFLSVPDNNADVVLLLSDEIIQRAPVDKIVVVGGRFLLEEDVKCYDS